LFSQVSGRLLSEKREDKIDDFVQEMEINGFWLLDKREAIAHILLKNVDFKNAFHCNRKFMSAEGLAEHVCHCSFRSLTCTNEGCNARFCASHLEKHDSVCPFKIVPCEQKCSGSIMRREMDRHCITVCPMKLVNCPFYALGCQSAIPYCVIEQHCSDTVHFHLLYVLQVIHKEASEEDLKRRVDQLEQVSFKVYFESLICFFVGRILEFK
jgi:homogentisate solanesyltransferase